MLTLVSKLADGYLSGQCRSPLSILLVQLPHCIALGMCFAATKFRLNRLRRWPSSSLNPLVGFQNSACILHAISLAAQPTTQSQHSIVDFQHDCPLHNSLFQLWTHGSFIWRPFHYTARSGRIWSHFSVNSPPSWWRLLLPSFSSLSTCVSSSLLQEPVSCFETNLSSAVPDAATTLLRLQSSDCHSLGDTGTDSKYAHTTCRVPHKASNAQWNSQFTGK